MYIAAWLHGIYVTADRACVFLSPIPPSLPFVTFNGKMCGQFPFCLHCFRQIKGLAKQSPVSYFIQNTHTCIYLYIYVNLFRISSSHALYSSTLLSVMSAGADLQRSPPLVACTGWWGYFWPRMGELHQEAELAEAVPQLCLLLFEWQVYSFFLFSRIAKATCAFYDCANFLSV